MRLGTDKPGYMQLSFRRDGAVELHVFATTDEFLQCGDADGEDVAECMREGVISFTEIYSSQLRQPHPVAPDPETR